MPEHQVFLAHHGILGQRWGIRRFQNKDGTLTKAGKKRYNESATVYEKDNTESKNRSGLTDKQKRMIKIGAAVAGTALLAYGAKKLVDSGHVSELADAGKQYVTGILGSGTLDSIVTSDTSAGIKKLTKNESISEAISKVNSSGSHNNCYNVVAAVAGRLCGLDVTAKGDTQNGRGLDFDEVCRVFKNNPDNWPNKQGVRITNPTVDKVIAQISNRFSDGDVGAIALAWNDTYKAFLGLDNAAHTLNWIKENGKVQFLDGQAQISGDRLDRFLRSYMATDKEVSIARFANTITGLNLETDVDLDLLKQHVD